MIQIIGILNLTPDSFSDGGKFTQTEVALHQAAKLFIDGADLVDVGAESTRPGAVAIKPEEEWGRMADFWQGVLDSKILDIKKFTLDTRNRVTAERFLKLGGTVINDVSGFQDPAMITLVAKYKATCIVNHFPGKMVNEVHEQNISSMCRVKKDLIDKSHRMMEQGVTRDKIILDPGIGFGKTEDLNKELLGFASIVPDWPVLIGYSKKRFLGKNRLEELVNVNAGEIVMATGAEYLRVHDPIWYR